MPGDSGRPVGSSIMDEARPGKPVGTPEGLGTMSVCSRRTAWGPVGPGISTTSPSSVSSSISSVRDLLHMASSASINTTTTCGPLSSGWAPSPTGGPMGRRNWVTAQPTLSRLNVPL